MLVAVSKPSPPALARGAIRFLFLIHGGRMVAQFKTVVLILVVLYGSCFVGDGAVTFFVLFFHTCTLFYFIDFPPHPPVLERRRKAPSLHLVLVTGDGRYGRTKIDVGYEEGHVATWPTNAPLDAENDVRLVHAL